jgi:hypothetical protein
MRLKNAFTRASASGSSDASTGGWRDLLGRGSGDGARECQDGCYSRGATLPGWTGMDDGERLVGHGIGSLIRKTVSPRPALAHRRRTVDGIWG